MKRQKKALVTGGTGFIGLHLADHLLDHGYTVTLIDNFFRSEPDDDFKDLMERDAVDFIEADLTDWSSWEKIGGGYEHVYHLASINGTELFYEIPHEVLRIGVLTIVWALEWNRRINNGAKILFTSSNEAYAGGLNAFDQLPIPTPEDVPLVVEDVHNPRWSYAGTKLIGEQFFIWYAKAYDFSSVIVRPHNFYGPRSGFKHVIPQVSERIVKRVDPFPIYGTDDTRTFCYITDAVEAMRMIMESDKTNNQTYHIGAKDEIVIRDLIETLFGVADWHPHEIEEHSSPEGSVKRRLADTSKIQNDVGWQATTSLEEGLKKTFEWYRPHYT